jgi:ACS family hexuronate transporter-like MFS transporter
MTKRLQENQSFPIGIVILLFAGTILAYVDRQILALLKPTLEAEFSWSDSDFAHLGSMFSLAMAFSVLLGGWLVDKFGVKKIYGLGVIVWSLSGMAHAVATSVSQFIAARAVLAAGESVAGPSTIKSIAEYLKPSQRSLALGIINMAPSIGAILTPLVIPAVALMFGWKAAFIVTGGLGFIWALFWFRLAKDDSPSKIAKKNDSEDENPSLNFQLILKDRKTWAITGCKALADMVWWFLLFWVPDLFGRVFHLSQAEIGAPVALTYAMAAFGALSSGLLYPYFVRKGLSSDKARKLSMLIYALMILPAPLALMVESVWSASLIIGLALFAHNGFVTNIFALTTEVIPSGRVGTVTALGSVAGNLTGVFMLEITGWSLDNGYGYNLIFLYVSIAYLLSLLWLHILLPRIKLVNY